MQELSPRSDDMNWGNLRWSGWLSLNAPSSEFRQRITTHPGFYRVRRTGRDDLVYVGQTGRNLRQRVRALAIHSSRTINEPPWNDPHTAAPLLWAYHHEDGFDFEVSVACSDLNKQHRQCCEDLLLYLHRVEHGHSTLCNHGRMHRWWTRPSNRKKGIAMTRRSDPQDYPSLLPAQGNDHPAATDWLGLDWSSFAAWPGASASDSGVYRIRMEGRIVYVGESKNLQARLRSHSTDPRFVGCDASFAIIPNAEPHQLKEREADLVGEFYLSRKAL
jgi:hypothetical protein